MKKILSSIASLIISIGLFGQGFYVEYKLSAAGEEGSTAGGFKTYAQDGNVRSEVSMNVPQMAGGMQITSLILKDQPNKMYLLNEKDKTYSEMETGNDEELKDRPLAEYEITVLGKEKVTGYNTTHVSIKVNGKQREELWTTKEITGYADFSKIKTKYTGKENMYKALAAKGADGMPVRIKMVERGRNMQMDLVKAEKRNNPASMFSLAGYKKGEGMSGIPGTEALQEMMKKMQDLTPAERDAMMKQLQEQYNKQPRKQ